MDRNKLRQRPVFIAGHPKAGTSLLLNLLDSHSQLLVFPEATLFFREVLPIKKEIPLKRWFELAERYLIDFFYWDLAKSQANVFATVLRALAYGIYRRLRQDYYFRMGSRRDEKGYV